MERKRSRIEIIHDILISIQNKGGKIKPTHLMYKANLSHVQMNSYLDELMGNNLVEKVSEGEHSFFCITNKGYSFVQKFVEMKEFEKTFGL